MKNIRCVIRQAIIDEGQRVHDEAMMNMDGTELTAEEANPWCMTEQWGQGTEEEAWEEDIRRLVECEE